MIFTYGTDCNYNSHFLTKLTSQCIPKSNGDVVLAHMQASCDDDPLLSDIEGQDLIDGSYNFDSAWDHFNESCEAFEGNNSGAQPRALDGPLSDAVAEKFLQKLRYPPHTHFHTICEVSFRQGMAHMQTSLHIDTSGISKSIPSRACSNKYRCIGMEVM